MRAAGLIPAVRQLSRRLFPCKTRRNWRKPPRVLFQAGLLSAPPPTSSKKFPLKNRATYGIVYKVTFSARGPRRFVHGN